MTTISAHQPGYIPWLGYFNKIAYSDIFIILDDVQFEKGSFVNRNRIKGPNGVFWLTIPLETHPIDTNICELRIKENKWWNKHLNSLYYSYKKAVNFDSWYNYLKQTICPNNYCPGQYHLFYHNILLSTDIGIKTEIKAQQNIKLMYGAKQQLIIDLCKHFKADRFIFGEKGRDYVDMELFKRAGIEPLFQEFKCIEYPQLWGNFVPKLSVVDALMNVGATRTRELIMEGWKP